MKTKILFSFIFILLITNSCKEDKETFSSGNFIEINDDKRIIALSTNVYLFTSHAEFNYEISDKQYSKDIAGYSTDELKISISITDSKKSSNDNIPIKDSYPLVDLNSHQLLDYARIRIILSKNGHDQYYFNSNYPTGNLEINRNKGNFIMEFSNIELLSGDNSPIIVSGRFKL